MLKFYQKIFLIVFCVLLLLPLGYVCGIKDTTQIYGALPQYNLPSLQEQHFGNREFQTAFEGYWTGHFLYHNAALKIKNQLYDWLNFGKVHSGYSENIIEGKKGWLFLKEYFNSYTVKCQSVPAEKLNRFAELVKIAQKHGKKVYFVLAPNKAVTYPQYLPERYKYFLGDDCGYYEKIENYMKELGIPVFNVQKFYRKQQFTKETEPFSRTGIHWNHYGAGIAAAEAAKIFGWGNIAVGKIEERNTPWTTERDIANLLNRYIPKNRYDLFYRPELSADTVWQGKTAVIGNSFSNEFLIALINSGMLSQNEFFHYENQPLTAEQARNVWNAERWIFVYTDIAVMANVHQMYAKAFSP